MIIDIKEINGRSDLVPGNLLGYYRLLSYLAISFDNCLFIDAGTNKGDSALALSVNSSNIVYSFDIEAKCDNDAVHKAQNIRLRIKNFLTVEEGFLAKSNLIFLDLDPHTGTMEAEIVEKLHSIRYDGILLLDDIYSFKKQWDKMEGHKHDVSEFHPETGFGIIDFSNILKIVR